jgi:hypothetical protein
VNRLPKCLVAAAVLMATVFPAGAQDLATSPPAKNWTLPLFTKEGFREMTIHGDEVHPVSSERIDITGMNVTVFSGTADAKVDSVLLSPEATFFITQKKAHGDGPVRLVRDDLEVTGEQWTYLYVEKKVIISKRAHVVFHSALPDMLK